MYKMKNLFLVILFSLVSTFLLQSSIYFYEDLSIGDVVDQDIIAPKSITYIDEYATEKVKEEEIAKIKSVYEPNENVSNTIITSLDSFFTSLISYKSDSNNNTTVIDKEENEIIDNPNKDDSVLDNNDDSLNNQNNISYDMISNPFNFTEEELNLFLLLDIDELEIMNEVFTKEVTKLFASGISSDDIETKRLSFVNNTNFYLFKKEPRMLLIHSLNTEIKPNLIYNDEETKKRKDEVLKNIKPVEINIQKDEIIVRYNDKITKEQLLALEKLGLTNHSFDYKSTLKMFPFILFLFLLTHFYIFKFYNRHFHQFKHYLFLLSCISLNILTINILTNSFNDYRLLFIPTILFMLLALVIWGKRFLIFFSIVISIIVSIKLGFDYTYLVLILVSGIFLSLYYNPKGKREHLIFNGILLGFVLSITHIIISYSVNLNFDVKYQVETSSYLLLFSFLASIGAAGLIPIIERLLGIITHARLHEFNDISHPLLKRLQREAKGTFDHSSHVGTLAEMAAEEIGANGLLLRVGAYFHDVGKLKSPHLFIENSALDENPHNEMNPIKSAEVILEHPVTSIQLCKEYKLPKPIIQLVASHHSDSILFHFYDKARKENPDVDISLFKYKTPTPKTKEEGILLIADSVEAFSRSIKGDSLEEKKKKIEKLIMSKVEKGDLRDCDLTISDIHKISKLFSSYLIKTDHDRPTY